MNVFCWEEESGVNDLELPSQNHIINVKKKNVLNLTLFLKN